MKSRKFKGMYLKLNQVNDKDVIDRLDEQENKQGYIKGLIRDDISLDGLRDAFRSGMTKVKEGTKEDFINGYGGMEDESANK